LCVYVYVYGCACVGGCVWGVCVCGWVLLIDNNSMCHYIVILHALHTTINNNKAIYLSIYLSIRLSALMRRHYRSVKFIDWTKLTKICK
jgi:hypothetical protein